ncbi:MULTISPECIES: hypothetical protein [Prochlorococcus]|uniref:hypothetical protein n=1 Tax=Prochlorococcus TaxID=1218 RepID=UPI000533BAC2|nr:MULTISPECIES: hypothetical protein [Prochlorococcus]KGG12780.1 hypothetical protein EV05_0451 [Prochlorococcus sp. MIT 0601]
MADLKEEAKLDWIKILSGFALVICAFCLALIVVSLRPLAKWANYQSICVEQQIEKAPISWAVRKCNGRSKVYQVK